MVAVTSRVDQLCRLLESLTKEEAADFLDRCQNHVDAMNKEEPKLAVIAELLRADTKDERESTPSREPTVQPEL